MKKIVHTLIGIVICSAIIPLAACQSAIAAQPAPTLAATIQPTAAVLEPTPTLLPSPVKEVTPPALIPRSTLFTLVDKTRVAFSRDGSKISYLAPYKGALNVFVAPANDPASAKAATDTVTGTRTYSWAHTNNHLVYPQDTNGNEDYRLYSVDLTTGTTKLLTPARGVRAAINRLSEKFPREILVTLNERDPALFDLHRLNIETGERQLILQNNEGFASIIADDDLSVRFVTRLTPDGGKEWLTKGDDGAWKLFMKISAEDESTTSFAGFDKSSKVIYMVDSRGRNTGAFTALNLETGNVRVIAEDPRADVADVLIHPQTREIQAVAFNYDRVRWQILDHAISADLNYLRSVADGDVRVGSRSLDDKKWIVSYILDNGPQRYYLYDREAKQAKFLFTNRNALEGLSLAKMYPVIIHARDGLELVSYLTLPIERDNGKGRPDKALPMVLNVHGGPWARDEWGLDSEHQWLANRGYAVLSVNFRGSDGFGKKFVTAGNREWAGKMHDDLIDAVRWAVQEKIADLQKVCVMGGSYGGYATLVALTFTPDVFSCGVDRFGPTNIVTLLNTVPPYWTAQLQIYKTRVGDHTTEEGRAFLNQRSPLTFVDRINKPLLIVAGANDPRVKQSESDQIVKAMQAKNLPVTYLLYPDEGHGFSKAINSRSSNAVTEIFLAHILGGRFEPIGSDLKNSSITVPIGADLIPGIEALATKK